MTVTIRQIDPKTGTSSYHEVADLADALIATNGIHDRHIIITEMDDILLEILPLGDEPDALHRVIARALGE